MITIALLATSKAISAEKLEFDGSQCGAGSNGLVTVRLTSGVAFQLPPSNYLLGLGSDGENQTGLPPYGCPGNPITVRSFGFPFGGNSELSEKARFAGLLGRPAQLTVIGFHGPAMIQESALRHFDHFKSVYDWCEVTEGGLETCRGCRQDPNDPDRCLPVGEPPRIRFGISTPSYSRALPGAHPEYGGLSYVMGCSDHKPTGSPDPLNKWCTAGYQIEEGLFVSYRLTDIDIKESDYLYFDLEVRRQIISARTPKLDTK